MDICNSDSSLIIFQLISIFIRLITIAVPILLIIYGMIDFYKNLFSNDPDVSKSMKIFLKRLGAAVLVFFVIPIVSFVIGTISPDSKAYECLQKFNSGSEINTNNEDEESVVLDDDIIAQNKEKCEANSKVYIKQLKDLVPDDAKKTEFYLESGSYSYICTDGEVE